MYPALYWDVVVISSICMSSDGAVLFWSILIKVASALKSLLHRYVPIAELVSSRKELDLSGLDRFYFLYSEKWRSLFHPGVAVFTNVPRTPSPRFSR